jgi:sigma-E factor negative regulatory protein RseB
MARAERRPRPGASAALLCASALLLGAPAVQAGQAAAGWFMRMAEAMRTQAYAGTLVYGHDRKLKTLELAHGYIDGREHERLSVLNGQPFEIIRQGARVTCIWPASQRARVIQRPQDLLTPRPPRGLESLPAHYTAKLTGTTRIAGRDARVLHIEAEDDYRYDYRLWLDEETALLLRSDLIDPAGSVRERLMFTRLQPLDRVTAERFEPSLDGMQRTRHASPAGEGEPLEDPAWAVTDLPPGFEATAHRSEAMPPHGMAVQHSVYSDGFASVSVFIEPPEADPMPLDGLARMGAVHAFGRAVDDHRVVVVGEVPAATVRRMATSVEPVAP